MTGPTVTAATRLGIETAELTHGTLESHDLLPARRFYEDVLGIRCVKHSPISQLIGGNGDTCIVSVKTGDKLTPQGPENRWILATASPERVASIREAALRHDFVGTVGDVVVEDGITSCLIQDRDSNWWMVTDLSQAHYQRYFERGDAS